MLARVADSLYWMGRYIERAEHVSRLSTVMLNATLDTTDTPVSGSGAFTMKSDSDNGATVHGGGELTMVKQ